MRKKLLILFYLIMMVPLFCNEWINSTGVGLRIPGYYSVQACDDKNYDSLNFKSDLVGIDLIYLGYKESGFSFKNDLELLFGNFKENGSNLVSFLENDEVSLSCTFNNEKLSKSEHEKIIYESFRFA